MVTLEITSTGIRLMEVRGRRITKWANHSLEPGIFEEEMISNPQALGTTVRQLMNSSGITDGNVTASVSGLYSLSRIVTVPTPLGQPVTQQAILDTMKDIIPFPEDELYVSWRTLASGQDGGHLVLLVGVPRDVIDSEVQALRAAGINPRTLDLKAMALARAVQREQALILNIEPTTLDMVVIVGGVIEIMRTTAWPQDSLSIEEKTENLASALELTVSFYNLHHPNSPLNEATPFFITGQLSGDFALVEKLQSRVGYPVESLAPPLEYPAHLPVSQYAVNIGLALKGFAPKVATKSQDVQQSIISLPDINLLPDTYRPWKPSSRQMQAFGALMVFLVLLFPFYQVTSGAMQKTADLKKNYTLINSKLQQMQTQIKNREPIQKAVQQYQSILDMGGGFTDNLQVINSLADELDVQIQTVVHENKSISVSCQTDSYTVFRDYKTALEESGMFLTPIPPPEGYPYTKAGTIKLEPKTATTSAE